jgi:hypothetical protein
MSSMPEIARRATETIKKIEKGEVVASDRMRRLIRMVAAVARREEAYRALLPWSLIATIFLRTRNTQCYRR